MRHVHGPLARLALSAASVHTSLLNPEKPMASKEGGALVIHAAIRLQPMKSAQAITNSSGRPGRSRRYSPIYPAGKTS